MEHTTFFFPNIALGQMLCLKQFQVESWLPFYRFIFLLIRYLLLQWIENHNYYGGNLQAMSIMGLYESAYWLSWLTWEAFLTLLASLFSVLFGMMFQFDFFKHNSFVVLFLVFFLFQFNMVSVCSSRCPRWTHLLVCVNVGC